MKTQKVTIAGIEVGIAYCYATEIAFANLTGGKAPADMIQSATVNPSEVAYLIISAIQAYYKDEESPVKDVDLMYEATPEELNKAFAAVIELFKEWYSIPKGAESKKKKGKESKNV